MAHADPAHRGPRQDAARTPGIRLDRTRPGCAAAYGRAERAACGGCEEAAAARLELPHALDVVDAAADHVDRGGEGIGGRWKVGVRLEREHVREQQVGRASDREELAFAHAAVERNVGAEVEPARARRRRRRALLREPRLEFLAPREALLHALALAAHGVAL